MSNIKYIIKLKKKERKQLEDFLSKGNQSCRIIRRVQIILDLDSSEGRKPLLEQEIAEKLNVTRQTVHVTKMDYIKRGINDFLKRKKRDAPPVAAKVDGDFEAHLIALCCSEPPKGYERWSVRLLADKCVELEYIDSISHMTISRTLKKTNLSLT